MVLVFLLLIYTLKSAAASTILNGGVENNAIAYTNPGFRFHRIFSGS